MTEWSRGERTVVRANPNYWRGDAEGGALPYLDEIVFRPIPDPATRRATLEAGDADATHDATPENTAFWRNDWEGELVAPSPDRDLWYLMMNLSAPPYDDPQFRRALAQCTDRAEYVAFRAPEATLANGPFAEGSLGHLPDAAFPDFDPEAANALLDEIGRPEVVPYNTTNTTANLLTAELFADMWSTNCGLNVDIDQFDQAELVTRALTGNFGVMQWRNHGRGHPGLEIHTWHSRHAEGLATNVGRLTDDQIDQLLFDSLATVDLAEVDAIGQEITRVFAENVYTIWLNTNDWSVPVRSGVNGVGVVALPSGSRARPSALGATWLTEAWIEE
jgi:peptide/nickel transport system substrate-binding protein